MADRRVHLTITCLGCSSVTSQTLDVCTARPNPKAAEARDPIRDIPGFATCEVFDKPAEAPKSYDVDLALITLPSPDAESVTVLTISGVPKWVVEQRKRVRLVVEE